ncbi:MAG: hypothetical protein HZC55_05310 [Verrucomicrobia bacterium]|nr:hypothetical protein [Verrucomicrobiota bacterium]
MARQRGVNPAEGRHGQEHADSGDGHAQFEDGVGLQRADVGRQPARQGQAAEAHPAHEGPEQNRERDGRGTDHQLQHLQPDNLVDQRGAAAADEQRQQQGRRLRAHRVT